VSISAYVHPMRSLSSIHLVLFQMFSSSSHFVSFAPCSFVCVSYQDSITVHCTLSYYSHISASRLSLTPLWWYVSFYIWWFGKLLHFPFFLICIDHPSKKAYLPHSPPSENWKNWIVFKNRVFPCPLYSSPFSTIWIDQPNEYPSGS
jgi:hypothetical protein